MLRGYVIPDNLSCPFVPYVFDEYATSKNKLMVVSHHHKGLTSFKEACEKRLLFNDLQKYARDFENGKNDSSPFWDFSHRLNKRMNGNELGFIWTCLSKLEQDNKLPDKPFLQFVKMDFCLLYQEIETVEPDIVVLLTGKDYDELMIRQLMLGNDSDIAPIKLVGQNSLISISEIKGFPTKIFRCHQPQYLKETGTFEQTLDVLCNLIFSKP
jgi:hypothetical protein